MRILTLTVFLIFHLHGWAQYNFVKNGGFDTVSACPSSLGQINLAQWTIPTAHGGTSDLFNACGASSVGVPTNFRADVAPAFNGTGYIGGYTYLSGGLNSYREYVTDTLKAPLTAGVRYVVSFMYLLADQSTYATDDLGYYLSSGFPTGTGSTGALGVTPTAINPPGNYLSDTINWHLFADTIVATGGELYITIGAFDSLTNAIQIDSNAGFSFAYMFYDSVSIVEYSGIDVANVCLGDTVFPTIDTVGVDSLFWDFDDPASGAANNSTAYFPAHFYANAGTYAITVVTFSGGQSDTVSGAVTIYPRQNVDLGPDTALCSGTQLIYSASQPFAQFEWHNASVADTFLTDGDTLVWVTVNGVCDTVSDTVHIIYDDSLDIDLGPDTLVCDAAGYTLVAGMPGQAEYLWSTGESAAAIFASQSDTFSVTATNICGVFTDTAVVIIKSAPVGPLLPPDTLNCYDDEIVLTRPQQEGTTYYWQDSTSKKTYTVDTTELVWLAAINECGTTIDTMELIFNGEILSDLGEDTSICNTDSIVLSAFSPGATYFWNTGDTADTVTTFIEDYLYIVTVTKGPCSVRSSKRVDLDDFFCPDIDCRLNTANVFTPNGDGVNDKWEVWSDCDILKYDLSIYNRWGQLIHHSNNAGYGWDGTINGEPAPDGTYFYELQFSDQVIVDVDRLGFRGSLTLMRD